MAVGTLSRVAEQQRLTLRASDDGNAHSSVSVAARPQRFRDENHRQKRKIGGRKLSAANVSEPKPDYTAVADHVSLRLSTSSIAGNLRVKSGHYVPNRLAAVRNPMRTTGVIRDGRFVRDAEQLINRRAEIARSDRKVDGIRPLLVAGPVHAAGLHRTPREQREAALRPVVSAGHLVDLRVRPMSPPARRIARRETPSHARPAGPRTVSIRGQILEGDCCGPWGGQDTRWLPNR